MNYLTIIGGGLAGSEAAWQAAVREIPVTLYEMRPQVQTGAHAGGDLAELVCSNSLGSRNPSTAGGLLSQELERLGSLLLKIAQETAVPAGEALAVDRLLFSQRVTQQIEGHPLIRVIREEVRGIPSGPVIIASGPLTSNSLSQVLAALTGVDHLYFFDALSPIVTGESISQELAFRGSRHDQTEEGVGDYINCPLDRDGYDRFVEALLVAERIPLKSFEEEIKQGIRAGDGHFFEGCLPVEILAERGKQALAFGPMRPTGLIDPRTGKRPYAVLQLRQDNLAGTLFNLVGFQTNLRSKEQEQVFRMIPALARAEFVRFGQMHRNTFISSPKLLRPTLQFKGRADLFFAGQLTGVEGYLGNIGTGLLAGINAARVIQNQEPIVLPQSTMLGALCHYVTHADPKHFQPMKANFGILTPLEKRQGLTKLERHEAYGERAYLDLNFLITPPSV